MKKYMALFLSLILLALCGCGKGTDIKEYQPVVDSPELEIIEFQDKKMELFYNDIKESDANKFEISTETIPQEGERVSLDKKLLFDIFRILYENKFEYDTADIYTDYKDFILLQGGNEYISISLYDSPEEFPEKTVVSIMAEGIDENTQEIYLYENREVFNEIKKLVDNNTVNAEPYIEGDYTKLKSSVWTSENKQLYPGSFVVVGDKVAVQFYSQYESDYIALFDLNSGEEIFLHEYEIPITEVSKTSQQGYDFQVYRSDGVIEYFDINNLENITERGIPGYNADTSFSFNSSFDICPNKNLLCYQNESGVYLKTEDENDILVFKNEDIANNLKDLPDLKNDEYNGIYFTYPRFMCGGNYLVAPVWHENMGGYIGLGVYSIGEENSTYFTNAPNMAMGRSCYYNSNNVISFYGSENITVDIKNMQMSKKAVDDIYLSSGDITSFTRDDKNIFFIKNEKTQDGGALSKVYNEKNPDLFTAHETRLYPNYFDENYIIFSVAGKNRELIFIKYT